MKPTVANPALERLKTVLWAIMGVWAAVTVARFWHGIGATTGLTDVAPWGFWIAFDVMAGVALAAGGFVVAALAYIFGVQRFHAFTRPAILTALLGYLAVAVGLLYDLGIPWHIWHPLIFPQHHSVLFEVAMCVMCYLTVLALEFSPAVLEHPLFHRPFFQRLLALIQRGTIPLVIAGIVLSTLHQSSLGSLFLIQPFRVHPLWYSPILYVLFFISAMGLGMMMVTLEALLSAWLFKHPVRLGELALLGSVASVVLSLYAILRAGDLWLRGIVPLHLDGTWQSGLFLFELLASAVVPAVLLALPRVRQSVPGLATCATLTVLGMIGYRFNICIVAFERPESMPYWPTWTELAVSLGIVAGAILLFIFFNENLRIVDAHGHPAQPADLPPARNRTASGRLGPTEARFSGQGAYSPSVARHSLAFVIAAAGAIGFLPEDAIFGPRPRPTPVEPPRTLEALAVPAPLPLRRDFHVASFAANVPVRRGRLGPAQSQPVGGDPLSVMVLDGNRDWRFVPFTHAAHAAALGERESCRLCHHQNLPFDQNTACSRCHRDMYEPTDTFDHPLHVYRLGGNAACIVCHSADLGRKRREHALACWRCHGDMVVQGSIVPTHAGRLVGVAPGYVDAMHNLCMGCHKDLARAKPELYSTEFGRCDVCHREFKDAAHQHMAPYVPMPPGHVEGRGTRLAPAPRARPSATLPADATERRAVE